MFRHSVYSFDKPPRNGFSADFSNQQGLCYRVESMPSKREICDRCVL